MMWKFYHRRIFANQSKAAGRTILRQKKKHLKYLNCEKTQKTSTFLRPPGAGTREGGAEGPLRKLTVRYRGDSGHHKARPGGIGIGAVVLWWALRTVCVGEKKTKKKSDSDVVCFFQIRGVELEMSKMAVIHSNPHNVT